MFKKFFWIAGMLLVLVAGYATLRPSFNLALTGDDYLGLWRYNYYLQGLGGDKTNNFLYFLTDYGPMDTLTAVIYHYFGFNHQVYYVFSFLLRVIASLSFIWPVFRLTKNRWASLGAAGFFLITTTGLEATDWSFNMPVYVAISLANILLGIFFVLRNNPKVHFWVISAILFILSIVAMPIRTMFLPVLMLSLEIYWLITNSGLKNLIYGVLRMSLYIVLLLGLLKYTGYGGAVSLRGSQALTQNFGQVTQLIHDKNYRVLVTPIAQIGKIFLPNNFLYQRTEIWGISRTFRRVVVPIFIAFTIGLIFLKPRKEQFMTALVAACAWSTFVWKSFMTGQGGNTLQPFELLAYLLGGYLMILFVSMWTDRKTDKDLKLGIVLALVLMVSGFILFWVRSPGTIYEITGRYLIIPGAGLAWFMAIFLAYALKTKNLALIIVFGLMFSLHAKSSYTYLDHLAHVRSIELTETLRSSLASSPDMSKPRIPIVYYFEGDNPDILHHAFIFGWPVISTFQFNSTGAWHHIIATDKWDDVVSAYSNGEVLSRFMPEPEGTAKLENIFAYRLQNRQLIDITDQRRAELQQIKIAPQRLF